MMGAFERRRDPRRSLSVPVDYQFPVVECGSLEKKEGRGKVVDISTGGLRLQTNLPLEEGHVLTFISEGHHDLPERGLVRWVQRSNGLSLAGLKNLL